MSSGIGSMCALAQHLNVQLAPPQHGPALVDDVDAGVEGPFRSHDVDDTSDDHRGGVMRHPVVHVIGIVGPSHLHEHLRVGPLQNVRSVDRERRTGDAQHGEPGSDGGEPHGAVGGVTSRPRRR